jgi:hypothetical protein
LPSPSTPPPFPFSSPSPPYLSTADPCLFSSGGGEFGAGSTAALQDSVFALCFSPADEVK